MRSLRSADVANKRVLVRVDFNVPIDKRGDIIDDTRIRESLPTLQYLVEKGAKTIIISHLGRPGGKRSEQYSMHKIANHLRLLMQKEIRQLDDCVGPEVEEAIAAMHPGDVVVLENVRFHPEEEKNDPGFCRQLAELADLYVNDAFGAAHRAHASTSGVCQYIPSVPGFLLEKEVTMLGTVLSGAESPRVAIVGGAKVGDKLSLLENMLGKMDIIIIGGGMANTFLKAQGYNVGNSLYEKSMLDTARKLLRKAEELNVKLQLPVDVVVADRFSEQAEHQIVSIKNVPDGWMILDIGPETVVNYKYSIAQARSLVWNGPMGVYEFEPFSHGTNEVAQAVADSKAVSVVGGGDSLAAVFHVGVQDRITHISTGGGATLEFLEGKTLPGLASCNCQELMVG